MAKTVLVTHIDSHCFLKPSKCHEGDTKDLRGWLHMQGVMLMERMPELGVGWGSTTFILKSSKPASWQGKDVTSSLGLLTANVAQEQPSEKKWSRLCILDVPGKNVQGCLGLTDVASRQGAVLIRKSIGS